jgi:DNA-binding NarL/FixJ family response regulator
MRKIKISVVEDECPFRESLVELIECSSELALVGAYANAEIALKLVLMKVPDVLVMDLNLPRLSGIECTRRLREALPELKILMLTKYEDADRIFQALEAGASGYLLKRKAPSELVPAVVSAYGGGAPMSSEVAARVVNFFYQRGKQNPDMQQLYRRVSTRFSTG